MIGKILANVFLISFLGLIQLSLISSLPVWFSQINIVLVVLVFILATFAFKLAVLWALFIGLILDLFSFLPFGSLTLALVATTLFAYFLLNNFFTNRSLYTFLALVSFSTLFFFLLNSAINYLNVFLGKTIFSPRNLIDMFLAVFFQIIVNLLVTIIFFYLFNFISQRLKPFFLVNRTK